MLTGTPAKKISHTLEVLAFHVGDLPLSTNLEKGQKAVAVYFQALAALVPDSSNYADLTACEYTLSHILLPQTIQICLQGFSREQREFLTKVLKLEERLPLLLDRVLIFESVYYLLQVLLRLPVVASYACNNLCKQMMDLIDVTPHLSYIHASAQVPLIISVSSAFAALQEAIDAESESSSSIAPADFETTAFSSSNPYRSTISSSSTKLVSGTGPIGTCVATSLLPVAMSALEQMCALDSVIIFGMARLIFVWLKSERAAVALTRLPPNEGLPKVIQHLGIFPHLDLVERQRESTNHRDCLHKQDRWLLRIIDRLLEHSKNDDVSAFLTNSVAYELMTVLDVAVRCVNTANNWPSLPAVLDVTKRIIGHGPTAARVVCDRISGSVFSLMRAFRVLTATADDFSNLKMDYNRVASVDTSFVSSLLAALANHAGDKVVGNVFRGCEDIEQLMVRALDTNKGEESDQMRRYILHILASLVLYNRGPAEQLAQNKEGARVFCSMLRSLDRDIHGHAAVVLCQLASFVPSFISEINKHGGFTDLINRLEASEQSDLSRLALVRLLVSLTSDPSASLALIEKGIIEMLVGFLIRFKGHSSSDRFVRYFELGVLRAFMKMCGESAVRRSLLQSNLLDSLKKVQAEIPSDILADIEDQFKCSGNEEEGSEAFLTNPEILHQLSLQMRKNLKDIYLQETKEQMQAAEKGEGAKGEVGSKKLIQQVLEQSNDRMGMLLALIQRLDYEQASADNLAEVTFNNFRRWLAEDSEKYEVCTVELYNRNAVSPMLEPEEHRRLSLAQARCISQMIAILSIDGASQSSHKPGAPLSVMISYSWNPSVSMKAVGIIVLK